MKNIIILFVITAVLLLAGCSTSQTGLEVGNMKNTQCGDFTRTSFITDPKIKFEYNGNDISVSLTGYSIACSNNSIDLYMDCQQVGNRLEMNVRNKKSLDSDIASNCMCYVNIYCTLYGIEGDNFIVLLDGREIGTISFKDHRIVHIDLQTLNQAFEEGFDYPVSLYDYSFREKTEEETDRYGAIFSYIKEANAIYGKIINFPLPCNSTKMELKMDVVDNDTLVLSSLADDQPCDGEHLDECNRCADIYFIILNSVSKSYHIKWNPHKTIVTGEDGSQHEEIVCDFEGDLPMGQSLMWN